MLSAIQVVPKSPAQVRRLVDWNRPVELISAFKPDRLVLTYRYLDTGVQVTVPNNRANWPVRVRMGNAKKSLDRYEKKIERLLRSPIQGIELETTQRIIAYYQIKARYWRRVIESGREFVIEGLEETVQ